LTTSRIKDRLVDDLIKEADPFVLIGRLDDHQPANWVNNDNVAVGAMAAEHLMSRGHRRIALINGPVDTLVALDRREGYRKALTRAGLAPAPELEADGGFSKEGGTRAMHQLLNLPEPPTAVFCADDAMAVGAIIALKERGRNGQVALVGVNDDPLTALTDPPLSTIRIPVFDLGATAARMLTEVLRRRVDGHRQVILPSQLVIRESSNWTLG
ncbi:MAG TPA: substrate-binding domain-containing protein, partial [Symbiobacteriaceae bacterium]|nr:substrate-binding domain-containing protein [Symbiobacteriaceae bacterium]